MVVKDLEGIAFAGLQVLAQAFEVAAPAKAATAVGVAELLPVGVAEAQAGFAVILVQGKSDVMVQPVVAFAHAFPSYFLAGHQLGYLHVHAPRPEPELDHPTLLGIALGVLGPPATEALQRRQRLKNLIRRSLDMQQMLNSMHRVPF